MKFLISVFFFSLVACSSHGNKENQSSANQSKIGTPKTVTDKAPDQHCHMYDGETCVSPIFDSPPDEHCAAYDGSVCISPIMDSPPDEQCASYSGSTCVSPLVPSGLSDDFSQ